MAVLQKTITCIGPLLLVSVLTSTAGSVVVSSEESLEKAVHETGNNTLQKIVSVLLATVGAIMATKNFENKFNNTHQRIGLAIYALIWLQPLIGLCRPHRGIKGRSTWYFLHWLLGTGVSLLGFINIYIGLYAYHNRTSNNVTTWVILLTAEVSFISFLYLLQDRWDYLQKQSSVLGAEEPIRPTYQVSSLRNKMGDAHS